MIRQASLAARGAAAASSVAGCLLAGGWPATALVVLAGLALLLAALPPILARRGQRPWGPPLTLAGFASLAAAGVLWGVGAGWMLLAVVAALCAWDLEHLHERLSNPAYAGSAAGRRAVENAHLARLLAVLAVGLLLGAVGLLAPARLAFLPALLLSLLALLGLSWVVSFFRAWSE